MSSALTDQKIYGLRRVKASYFFITDKLQIDYGQVFMKASSVGDGFLAIDPKLPRVSRCGGGGAYALSDSQRPRSKTKADRANWLRPDARAFGAGRDGVNLLSGPGEKKRAEP